MSEQPEPDSGWARDRRGQMWTRSTCGTWSSPTAGSCDWWRVCQDFGPMAPLLPAVRPDGVPDDAVPFVGWVSWGDHRRTRMHFIVYGPGGVEHLAEPSVGRAEELGLPVPAAPAPSLPERLRTEAERGSTPETERLLIEAADALEAGRQP